jgi:hypothetical protein
MPDFESILDKPIGSIEAPAPKPVGTFVGVLMGVPEIQKIGKDEHQVVDFKVKLLSAEADVDADQLAAAPPLNEWPQFQLRRWANSEDAIYSLQEWLKNTLDCTEGTPIRQALAETAGKQLKVTMKNRPGTNRDGQPAIFFEVGDTAHI